MGETADCRMFHLELLFIGILAMEHNMRKIVLLFALILLFLIGVLVGSYLMALSDYQYKEASIETCEYANNLTRIINIQIDFIESSDMMKTEDPLTRLNYLNCDLLSNDKSE